MKKWISILLVLILSLPFSSFCLAEEIDRRALVYDRKDIRFGISLMAEMVGNALDQVDETKDDAVRNILSSFAQIDYLSPDKAIVMELTRLQQIAAIKALKIEEWHYAAQALGEIMNQKSSDDYYQAAKLSQLEHLPVDGYGQTYYLVILLYGDNIAIFSIYPGALETKATGSFIMNTLKSPHDLNVEIINQYAQQYRVKDATIHVYEKQNLDQLLTEDSDWGGYYTVLTRAVCSSEKRRQILAPKLLRSDSPYVKDVSIKLQLLESVLKNMEYPDQDFLREVSSDFIPSLAEWEDDPLNAYLDKCDIATVGKIPVPQIEYGNMLHETQLKPDGTYLVLFSLQIPDQDPEKWYDVIMEAALPADRIPKSLDEADYVISCKTTYEDGLKDNGAYVHYPLTNILIYDAQSGELLKRIGSVKRLPIRGTTVYVTHKGDTWWEPLRTMIWDKIKPLFEDTANQQ